MNGLIVLILIALAHTAASAAIGDDFKVESCTPGDKECIDKGFKYFLKKAAEGIPKYDIKAFDPLEIEDFKYNLFEDYVAEFKNVKINGFKDQEFKNFDIENDFDKYESKANIVIDTTIFMKGEKEYQSPYQIKATIVGSVKFPKKTEKKDGKEYVVLGEETITCEVEGAPEVTLDEKARDALNTDPSLKKVSEYFTKNTEEIRKKIACAFAEEAYKAQGASLRKLLAIVPVKE